MHGMPGLPATLANLAKDSVWKVLDQTSMGSDHFPILSKIGVEVTSVNIDIISRWKFKSADWDKFKDICEDRFKVLVGSIVHVDELNGKISEIFSKTAEEVIVKSSHLYLYSAYNNTDCVKALNSIKLEDRVSV